MWIATVAIVLQVFYNLECGRYALYCGEPVFTGFMRMRPGPGFWIGLMLLLNRRALIPGLSTHGAAIIASLWLDRPPTADDKWLVTGLAYACLLGVALPVLIGGKVYNMLQARDDGEGAVRARLLPAGRSVLCRADATGGTSSAASCSSATCRCQRRTGRRNRRQRVRLLLSSTARGPLIALANIAVLGAFAGYAGGGGLANSTYSNFVRDKGWGMGSQVGAIASAVGGTHVTLSHVGKVFPITAENLRRWRGWWRYILTDQICVWAPGCFMGMALPALMSIQFAPLLER